MASGAKTVVVGIGALAVGGLLGGVIGAFLGLRLAGPAPEAWPLIPSQAEDPTVAPRGRDGQAARPDDSEAGLLRAIDELTAEVRGLRAAFEQPTSARTSPEGGTPELERLAELLEVLTTSLKTQPRAGTGPGYQGSPLVVPRGEPRRDRIADVAELPQEARSRDLRFLTYQQVLDRFGHPDEVTQNGVWLYFDPATEKISVEFRFVNGLVTNVY